MNHEIVKIAQLESQVVKLKEELKREQDDINELRKTSLQYFKVMGRLDESIKELSENPVDEEEFTYNPNDMLNHIKKIRGDH